MRFEAHQAYRSALALFTTIHSSLAGAGEGA